MKRCRCGIKDVTSEFDEDHPEDVVENIIGNKSIEVPRKSSISFQR